MEIVLKVLSAWAFFAWAVIMLVLRAFLGRRHVLVQYLDGNVTRYKNELIALNNHQAEVVGRLKPADQLLHCRAAKRRYWKGADPFPYGLLYRKMGYSVEEAESIMVTQEKMPGYFRAKVRAIMVYVPPPR